MAKDWQYNPLSHIVEHPQRPWARFLRTSFSEKCLDTFVAFIGRQNESFQIEAVGIIDYLTLGIGLALHQLFMWSYRRAQHDINATLLFIPLLVSNIASWLFKLILSGIATLLSLPVIGIAQGISWWGGGGEALYKQTLSLTGTDKSSVKTCDSPTDLKAFLQYHERDLSDLSLNITIQEPSYTTQALKSVSKWAEMLYIKGKPQQPVNLLATTKLTFFYNHPENTPILSNYNFIYSSVVLMSMFPWLAALSARSFAESAIKRTNKAIWGGPKDVFEVEIDRTNNIQQQQLSALFKLNVANVLFDIFPNSPEAKNESTAEDVVTIKTASDKEKERLQQLAMYQVNMNNAI